ncbi:hypothetical protein [Mycolicibacterium mengxianglii]|uniref:hypothetical protein n=1 Tax=Mycolicibacterium mengxianglii TaxID=2736649 RepID=UPI0018D0134C|nr:hypothetical protein [Mycolicibacterium mengxianglii]
MTRTSFASWDDFIEAQGLEFRLKLIELAGVLGDDFISFVLAAPRADVMDSVPSDAQRAVVDELMAVHLEQKKLPDLQQRSRAMLETLCGHQSDKGHSRATGWHIRCGGAPPEVTGDSLEALLATIVADVVSAPLFNPRLLIHDIVSQHPAYEATVEKARDDEALTAMFRVALENSDADTATSTNLFAIQVMLQTSASTVSGSVLLRDVIMNLLSRIHLRQFDWKAVLPAAQVAVVENLNIARTLSQGLEATVQTYVGLLGVDLSPSQEPLDHGDVRIRQSNAFDAKCLNNTDGIRVVAELPTKIKVLRCEYIPPPSGSAEADLARDFERLERRKHADTSDTDQVREQIRLRIERLKFSLLLAIQGKVAPVREAFWEIHNPISLVADSYSRSAEELTYTGATETLDPTTMVEFLNWWSKSDRIPPALGIGMRRLLKAAGERNDPVDVLVDAVVSWENLFGSKTESTFRVTGAVAMLLEPKDKDKRDVLQKELSGLYGQRSRLVHGDLAEGDRRFTAADARSQSARALQIGVEVFREVLKNEAILTIAKSEERGRRVVLDLIESST